MCPGLPVATPPPAATIAPTPASANDDSRAIAIVTRAIGVRVIAGAIGGIAAGIAARRALDGIAPGIHALCVGRVIARLHTAAGHLGIAGTNGTAGEQACRSADRRAGPKGPANRAAGST